VPRGYLRGHAISLRGFKLVRVWFVFPEQRIKVPNSWELGPFAGDVHDNGNANANDGCSPVCKKEVGSCLNNPKWMPVNCTTTKWVWSSDKAQAMTLALANTKKVLWSGCTHAPAANTCSLDGKGWVSTQQYVMAGCNATWYHLGGEYTGNCGGHDGDSIRRLALTQTDCYDY